MVFHRRPFLSLPFLTAASPAHAARFRAGEVSAVTGSATALFPGEPDRALLPAAPVLIEDVLATGANSRLSCQLQTGLALRLGENARLRLDALVLRGPEARLALHELGNGALLIDRPPDASAPPIELSLPWARIGVRGTRFFVGVMAGTGAVFVSRGLVMVETTGTRVMLEEGQGVDVPLLPTGPPDLRVQRWATPRIARAMAMVE